MFSYNSRSVRKSWIKGDDKRSSVRVVLWPWFKSFVTRLTFFSVLRKRRLYPRSTKELISSWQRLLKKMSVEQMQRKRRARLNGIVRLV